LVEKGYYRQSIFETWKREVIATQILVNAAQLFEAIVQFQNNEDSIRNAAEAYYHRVLAVDPDEVITIVVNIICPGVSSIISRQCLCLVRPWVTGRDRAHDPLLSQATIEHVRSRMLEYASSSEFDIAFHSLLIQDLTEAGAAHYRNPQFLIWPALFQHFTDLSTRQAFIDSLNFWADGVFPHDPNPEICANLLASLKHFIPLRDPMVIAASLKLIFFSAQSNIDFIRHFDALSLLSQLPDEQFPFLSYRFTQLLKVHGRSMNNDELLFWEQQLIDRIMNEDSDEVGVRAYCLRHLWTSGKHNPNVFTILMESPGAAALWNSVFGQPDRFPILYATGLEVLSNIRKQILSSDFPQMLSAQLDSISSAFLRELPSTDYLSFAVTCAANQSLHPTIRANCLCYIKRLLRYSGDQLSPRDYEDIGAMLCRIQSIEDDESISKTFLIWCERAHVEVLRLAERTVWNLVEHWTSPARLIAFTIVRSRLSDFGSSEISFEIFRKFLNFSDEDVKLSLRILPMIVPSLGLNVILDRFSGRAELFFQDFDVLLSPDFISALSKLRDLPRDYGERIFSVLSEALVDERCSPITYRILTALGQYVRLFHVDAEMLRHLAGLCTHFIESADWTNRDSAAFLFLAVMNHAQSDLEIFQNFFEFVMKHLLNEHILPVLMNLVDGYSLIAQSKFLDDERSNCLAACHSDVCDHVREIIINDADGCNHDDLLRMFVYLKQVSMHLMQKRGVQMQVTE
jgi:hypothetical protein